MPTFVPLIFTATNKRCSSMKENRSSNGILTTDFLVAHEVTMSPLVATDCRNGGSFIPATKTCKCAPGRETIKITSNFLINIIITIEQFIPV